MVSRLLHLAKNGSFGSKLPINYGTPKVLPRKIRSLLAKHLGVEEKVLTHADAPAAGAVGNYESPPRRRHNAVEIHEIDVRASAGPDAINEGLEARQRRGCSRKPLCGMNCVRRPSTCA
jgi:hypothetical protein